MKRLTLDSNIYISALEFGGLPMRLLEQARAREVEVALSREIILEIQKVLKEKFNWPEERLEQFERNVSTFTHRIEPIERLDVVTEDADDNRILECAVAAGSEAIVTGDHHILKLRVYRGIRMLRVSDVVATHR